MPLPDTAFSPDQNNNLPAVPTNYLKPTVLLDYAEEKTMPKFLIDAYKMPISSIFSA